MLTIILSLFSSARQAFQTREAGTLQRLPASSTMVTTESPTSRVSHITLDRKQTGKPIAGNRHDGFEAAGAGTQLTVQLLRPSQRKRGATDRQNLRSMALALDPTNANIKSAARGISPNNSSPFPILKSGYPLVPSSSIPRRHRFRLPRKSPSNPQYLHQTIPNTPLPLPVTNLCNAGNESFLDSRESTLRGPIQLPGRFRRRVAASPMTWYFSQGFQWDACRPRE